MAQLIQEREPCVVGNPPQVHQLPLYWRIMLLLLLGFSVVTFSTLALSRTVPVPSNPFITFSDVLPGQPDINVLKRGFLCERVASHSDMDMEMHCMLRLSNGSFSRIQVLVLNTRIVHTTFVLGDGGMRAGDLMGFWAAPEIHEFEHSAYLFWRKRGVNALISIHPNRFTWFRPVWRVYFLSGEPLPDAFAKD